MPSNCPLLDWVHPALRATPDQKTFLLEYLERRPLLAQKEWKTPDGRVDALAEWAELKERLNAIPRGSEKSTEKWLKIQNPIGRPSYVPFSPGQVRRPVLRDVSNTFSGSVSLGSNSTLAQSAASHSNVQHSSYQQLIDEDGWEIPPSSVLCNLSKCGTVPHFVPRPSWILEKYLREKKIQRYRTVRDSQDPFNVSCNHFTHHYRLSQDMLRWLAHELRPFLSERTSSLAIPMERKLLCALSFYATGGYQRDVGSHIDHALCKATVCNIINETTDAIQHPDFACRFIKFPRTREEAQVIIDRNRALGCRIPNVVGFIDGSLIRIMKPGLQANIQAHIGRNSAACINAQFVSLVMLRLFYET
ncbi:LOW QUALITY PROTEIN: 60 kDa SS-A/Ro ribonucleoprotein [Frankliniella fusca]|uniref:60 kDa SS-A/Ro ribonucleoprotein n=1 Tax=Frankliniella fusca TaxID=407009 RepID=A0AAE1LQ21_9NEOP|nr:LOW QUALITY PROTEIN: 60 kDa SS-A/Ro ribonucleoprotein [Frankliniella fusca]